MFANAGKQTFRRRNKKYLRNRQQFHLGVALGVEKFLTHRGGSPSALATQVAACESVRNVHPEPEGAHCAGPGRSLYQRYFADISTFAKLGLGESGSPRSENSGNGPAGFRIRMVVAIESGFEAIPDVNFLENLY